VDNHFQGTKGPGGFKNPILYTAVIPQNLAMNQVGLMSGVGATIDYGMQLQAGYFIVPKKWEVAARWGFINGQSGDIYGNGTFRQVGSVTPAGGAATPLVVYNNAFKEYHQSNEYTIGLNRYWRRQLFTVPGAGHVRRRKSHRAAPELIGTRLRSFRTEGNAPTARTGCPASGGTPPLKSAVAPVVGSH